MRVTLKDIAEVLDVSVTTVSRALNNQGRIGASTREMVIAKAVEMGYEIPVSDSVVNGKMVGIVFDRRLQSLASDPFYGIVMLGVEKQCQEYHTQVFFHTTDLPSDQRLWSLYAEGRLHGLIIVGGDISEDFIRAVHARKIPFVLVDNCLQCTDVDSIVTDNAGGIRKVMSHLLSLGHKRIGFVGGPLSHSSLSERYSTYLEVLKDNGIHPQKDWNWIHSEPGPSVGQGYQAVKAWHSRGLDVTAIVTDNDSTAIGVLKACAELGIRVPDDLSVVGFDNISMAEHVSPGITSVHIHKMKMGEWAAKRLHEIMDHEDTPIKITIGTELVVRRSSGPCKNLPKTLAR